MASAVQPKYTQLFINNEFVDSVDGKTFETVNPVTEEVITSLQRASNADAELAVEAANRAFDIKSEWRNMGAARRGDLMFKLASLMEENIDELAALESLDNGKPLSYSKNVDLGFAIRVLKYYAGFCDKIQGTVQPVEGHFCYTRKEPVGVCAQIIPWNFPILMLIWKWGPCLASGSVSILKPSEKTPLTALRMASLAKEAGFPPGVVQVLPGYGDVGEYLVKHPKVDKIAFTGSTKVGLGIMQKSGLHNLKRVTLELGGKSPNIICHDADLDLAVETAQIGLFFNQGQCCVAGSRIYVHQDIYEKFVEKMIERVQKIRLGDPFEETTEQGPQVDKIQFDNILRYIDIGKKEGAKCVLGGERHGEKGYYIKPTIFTDVEDQMTISREEIFGPVMQISKFSDYDEVIRRANDSEYGLGAGVITESIDLYQQLANGIRAGTVYVNCYSAFDVNTPFGGFKNSGLGREMGPNGLDSYLENKTVIVKRGANTLP